MKAAFLIVLAATMPLFAASESSNKGDGSEGTKPEGFRFFNNRLTIKPYVSLSYSYDSNIDTTRSGEDDNIFCVEPGADFVWRGERWELAGNLWYRYNAYCDYSSELGENSFGEALTYKWSNVGEEGRGWNLMLGERYAYISQNDSLTSGDGRGLWRDRERLDISGALERRITDRWHASVMGQYNWLDYKNNKTKYAPLYGNSQYAAGLETGYVLSPWTDLLLSGGFSRWNQEQGHGTYNYSDNSDVWTVQAGVGTHATKNITYRLLGGASWLEYGGHSGAECGWTYQLSANWRITRQLQMSVLGSSYYQPSEVTLGQAIKVYALSGGVSYLTLGDRMTLTADIAYRKEDNVYSDYYLAAGNDFTEDIVSVRLGATYTLNRWMSIFANVRWEEEWADGTYSNQYNYDRFVGTVGMRFHY